MDRLISEQAVIESIEFFQMNSQHFDFVNLIDDIKEIPSAEQRWIPVSERLPEKREWYLAVFKEFDTGIQLIPRVADYIGKGKNEWQLIDEGGLVKEYRDLLECVAWMPLPEPYKAESEG